MKQLNTIIILLMLSTLFGYAQKRGPIKTTTQDMNNFNNEYTGYTGKITYSYYEDVKGNHVKHGTYRANGSSKSNVQNYRTSLKVTTKYTALAKFKDGWLDGPITINITISEAMSDIAHGSRTDTRVYKFSGAYKEGIHHGQWKFTTTKNGKLIRNNVMSFNNGEYSGSYSAPVSEITKAKGNFNTKGYPIGKWIETCVDGEITTTEYIEGFYISHKTIKNGKVLKSEKMKQGQKDTLMLYLDGKISKKELEKDYVLCDNSLGLSYAFNEFYMQNFLNIGSIGGDKYWEESSDSFVNGSGNSKSLHKLLSDDNLKLIAHKNHLMRLDSAFLSKNADKSFGPIYTDSRLNNRRLIYVQNTPEDQESIYYFSKEQDSIYNILEDASNRRQPINDINYTITNYGYSESKTNIRNAWRIYYNSLDIYNLHDTTKINSAYLSAKIAMNIFQHNNIEYFSKYAQDIKTAEEAKMFFTLKNFEEIAEEAKENEAKIKRDTEIINGLNEKISTESSYLNENIKKLSRVLQNDIAWRDEPYKIRDYTYGNKNYLVAARNTLSNAINKKDTTELKTLLQATTFAKDAVINKNFKLYNSIAKLVKTKEDAITFFAPGMDYYEKLFDLDTKFSKFFSGLFNEKTIFEDASQYKEKEIIGAFILFNKAHNKSDSETAIKVMDRVIEMSENSKYYSIAANSVTNYDDALSFFTLSEDYYNKLFQLHELYSQKAKKSVFTDASLYNYNGIVNAFILFFKENNKKDEATAIKIMDRAIEMHNRADYFNLAAKHVSNKEEALTFFSQSEDYFNKLFQLHDLYNKKSKDSMFEDATLYEYDGIVNAFILFFKEHNMKDEATAIKIMDIATQMKDNAEYYNAMAKTVTKAEEAISFFSSDMNYYNKLFSVDVLYGKKSSKEAVFTDASQYKEKELINAFIIFLNGHDKNDKETILKVMDNLIKMKEMKCKKVKNAAKKISTYEDALNFLQNTVLGLCK